MLAAPALPQDAPLRRLVPAQFIELMVLAAAVMIGTVSYFVVSGNRSPMLLAPPLVALLLVANLVPGIALLVLIGRRVAMRRAAQSAIGGRATLHVRLVALFSTIAAVPTLLVVIFASLLFQYGVEFWSSDRARSMLENASTLAQENYRQELARVSDETRTMSGDLGGYLRQMPIESRRFQTGMFLQTLNRNLSEAMIFRRGDRDPLAVLNPYGRPLASVVTEAMMNRIDRGASSVIVESPGRSGALVAFPYGPHTYLYAARVFDPQLTAQIRRGQMILADYQALQTRSRSLQLKFNAALLLISLLIVGIAVWIALAVADRLVRPVGDLVEAANRVAMGDLSARVPEPKAMDEVGTLGRAFNLMTGRLQEQTGALESRRALIEAVMSGVSAGVVSIDADSRIRLINRSAAALLSAEGQNLVGRPLAVVSPELAGLIDGETREGVVEIGSSSDPRTLAVKITRADEGPILTFDDITGQLLDQRRAAWSDVARRIAHEIKNPLTPIQLAAERLQRRYGKQVPAGDDTFQRLTDTIVRQVGDLRRMVDEFSSFARMPKPEFRSESLLDMVRQTQFLHEVGHPDIRYRTEQEGAITPLVCDRRQIAQALTNLIKNAAEAVEALPDASLGEITVSVAQHGDEVSVAIADNGIGLPAQRERLVEPYVTTRARGTGLGLAIVKKIVEDHFGRIDFADRPGGGTVVSLRFNRAVLAALAPQDASTTAGVDLVPELFSDRIA